MRPSFSLSLTMLFFFFCRSSVLLFVEGYKIYPNGLFLYFFFFTLFSILPSWLLWRKHRIWFLCTKAQHCDGFCVLPLEYAFSHIHNPPAKKQAKIHIHTHTHKPGTRHKVEGTNIKVFVSFHFHSIHIWFGLAWLGLTWFSFFICHHHCLLPYNIF